MGAGGSLGGIALAAHLGDPAARELLGFQGSLDFRRAKQLKRWCLRLQPWSWEVWVRAAFVAAMATGDHLRRERQLLMCVSLWLACPCARHADEAVRLTSQIGAPPLDPGLRAAYGAALAVAQWAEPAPLPPDGRRVRDHARPIQPAWTAVSAAADALGGPDRYQRVHAALARVLIPWALSEL
ncbi:MAG: hypothetical protein AB7N76_11570 [Planctomycetota bacterium]